MKNYLGRLGLPRKTPVNELSTAIDALLDQTGDVQSLADAQVVFEDATMRTHYERTHLQYEAINAALHCLESTGAVDTHRWTERLVEFDLDPEEPIDPQVVSS